MCVCIVDSRVNHADQFVAVGRDVKVRCHASNSTPVIWNYRRSKEQDFRNVYDRRLIGSYQHRCGVDDLTYDLTIRKVQLNDTGEYWCIENDGFGTMHVTVLYVTGMIQSWFSIIDSFNVIIINDKLKVTTNDTRYQYKICLLASR